MSLDSHAQVLRDIKEEVDKWDNYWEMDNTFEVRDDLVQCIYHSLLSGRALDPALTQTTDYDEEQYN